MYYEAAAVDGAGEGAPVPLASRCRCSAPIIFFNLVLQIIHAFQSFTQAYVVSGGTGGPAGLDAVLHALYLYQRGFGNFDMGYASATGLAAAAHRRGLHRVQLLGLEVLGVLR